MAVSIIATVGVKGLTVLFSRTLLEYRAVCLSPSVLVLAQA